MRHHGFDMIACSAVLRVQTPDVCLSIPSVLSSSTKAYRMPRVTAVTSSDERKVHYIFCTSTWCGFFVKVKGIACYCCADQSRKDKALDKQNTICLFNHDANSIVGCNNEH
ncbi:hypothetical protein U9M48_020945 [Paspalum notatum var. saurae]|uniref:Uncharacterized protein n=1 Tax=Paspalum notatum var. saurae TaxID=547442 RepID=A0AAQ3TG72_PASNO